MPRYIDANLLLQKLSCVHSPIGSLNNYFAVICQKVENMPTADVAEVKHGEWILHNDGSGTCKVCGRHQKHIWDMCGWQKYCGHCGALMDGDKTE